MSSLATLSRFLRTAHYLRSRQIVGQLRMRFWRARPRHRKPPQLRHWTMPWVRGWTPPNTWMDDGRFCFLNVEGGLEEGWNPASQSMLWRYNLHYFDYLHGDMPHQEGLALIEQWIRENPPGTSPAWDSYTTSLRVVNWIRFHLEKEAFPPPVIDSLAHQARYVCANLETHLLANHLFANAKALLFAGLFFGGREGDKWLNVGLQLLSQEIPEQFLPDGGHFERSPMYHSIMLCDLLDLLNALEAAGVAHARNVGLSLEGSRLARLQQLRVLLQEKVREAANWLSIMLHPDGRIPLFGDAALGVAPSPEALDEYGRRLGLLLRIAPILPGKGPRAELLPCSGYAVLSAGAVHLAANVGGPGPDYQPGHAHADSLSFELSVGGKRLIVDRGTSTYDRGELRELERSTAAHNTLSVNGENTSEVWASFRVGRRAQIVDLESSSTETLATLCAAHDGFCHITGVGVHRRKWHLSGAQLRIIDEVEGEGKHTVTIRFLLHPDVEVQQVGDRCVLRVEKIPMMEILLPEELNVTVETTEWSPWFNQRIPTSQLVLSGQVDLPFRCETRLHMRRQGQLSPEDSAAARWPRNSGMVGAPAGDIPSRRMTR